MAVINRISQGIELKPVKNTGRRRYDQGYTKK